MEKIKILVIGSEIHLSQDMQRILENEGYEVIIILLLADNLIQQIESIKPQLVIIDNDIKGEKNALFIGKYLLNEDSIPFMYISSQGDNITLEQIKITRPYGFLIKPFREIDLKASVKLTLYNYSHKNIDLLKTDKKSY